MVGPPPAAEWQPLEGVRVLIHGLVGENAVFNGCHGHVHRRCSSSQRLIVCVDESRARLRVYASNVRPPTLPSTLPPCNLRIGTVATTVPSELRAAGSRCVVQLQPLKRQQLGFGAEAGPDGLSLRVTRLDTEGLLWEWNAKNPGSAVQLGDRIVEVNGRSGSTRALVEALRSPGTLAIVVQRGSGCGGGAAAAAAATSCLPMIAEKGEAGRPPEQSFAGTGFERRGRKTCGGRLFSAGDGCSTPSESALALDKEQSASLLHSLKMMVAQLEVNCHEDEWLGRRSG